MARPNTPQEMLSHYESGVNGVTAQDFCDRQTKLGVSPSVCQARFANYKSRVQGKGQKFLSRWQGGS